MGGLSFDAVGPYDEEPDDEEAEHPKPINETWVRAYNAARNGNETLESSWGSEFCTSHRTGYFCDGSSRIRCCKQVGVTLNVEALSIPAAVVGAAVILDVAVGPVGT